MKRIIIAAALLSVAANLMAQFEPAAEVKGTTAIYKDSSVFKDWAKSCKIVRGYSDIATKEGYAGVGSENSSLGKAGENGVVSLGDGGNAVLTFTLPITNGNGFDFAVFENGFREAGTALDYMEFAFVEASSDGINYFRFPSGYSGNDVTQLGSFESTLTTYYHNLAGKYWTGYGTPFDLEELKDISLLDINNVTHIKIVDVIGTLNDTYASHDSKGRKINDPYPTDFASGGFDLDAVGVIHQANPLGLEYSSDSEATKVYPNPSNGTIFITGAGVAASWIKLCDVTGNLIQQWQNVKTSGLDISKLKSGIYVLTIENENEKFTEKLIIN